MKKQAPEVEWVISESDADWERLPGAPLPNGKPTVHRRLPLKRFLWAVAAIIGLLASTGGWWWRMDRGGAHQAAAQPSATRRQEVSGVTQRPDPLIASVTGNQSDPGWWPQHGQEVRDLRATAQTAEPAVHLDVAMDTVDVQGNRAVARVVMYNDHGMPAYRQTRFYQRTSTAWVRAEPMAALWGPERSLETTFFVFHFRQHDALAVIAVAPQIDELYTTLQRNFGLPLTPRIEKLVIDVSVTHPPDHPFSWFVVPDRLIVPSPALYWAPVELTDAELLAQSIALPLLDAVSAQASEQYALGSAWQPMLRGLHLWQGWDLDLPLAAWRPVVVQWLYADVPADSPGQPVLLPDRYQELCAAHKLWLRYPAQIDIPLLCNDLDRKDRAQVWGKAWNLLSQLDQLAVPVPQAWVNQPFLAEYPLGQTVALATLIEYAVATYGRERLPALLAGLGQYDSWDTLLPAVYGVSATEFEAGWQVYLAMHYGYHPD